MSNCWLNSYGKFGGATRRRFFAICEKPQGGGLKSNPPAGARVNILDQMPWSSSSHLRVFRLPTYLKPTGDAGVPRCRAGNHRISPHPQRLFRLDRDAPQSPIYIHITTSVRSAPPRSLRVTDLRSASAAQTPSDSAAWSES